MTSITTIEPPHSSSVVRGIGPLHRRALAAVDHHGLPNPQAAGSNLPLDPDDLVVAVEADG